MKRTGDFHNFGQRVEEKGEQNPVFSKPRTVFWEHLFFGKQSPLLPILNQLSFSNGAFTLGSLFCRLEVSSSDSWRTGEVKKIFESTTNNSDQIFLKFGALAGYATAMGLQDLHRENVLFDEIGPLPVDIEIVFSKIILPNETHLMSRQKDRTTPLSLAQEKWPFDGVAFFEFLDGFSTTVQFISAKVGELRQTIESAIHGCTYPPPVRVLLRPTQFYREWFAGKGRETLLSDEETLQLERGDVPYFFKSLGGNPVSYFEKPNEPALASVSGEKYGAPLAEVLNETKLMNEILPLGCLFFLRNFLASDWRGEWKNDVVEITCGEDVSVKIKDKVFRSAR